MLEYPYGLGDKIKNLPEIVKLSAFVMEIDDDFCSEKLAELIDDALNSTVAHTIGIIAEHNNLRLIV